MSRSLNHWVANVQATFAPNGIGFGTFHPDDDALLPDLADEAFVQLGLKGAKLHPQVGHFALDDPRLDPVYERAIEHGALLLIHAGRLPEPPPIQRVLEFQDRVVFGSDFPNIPYRLESAIQSILDLRLGRALEEKLLCTNAARLLGLDLAEVAKQKP